MLAERTCSGGVGGGEKVGTGGQGRGQETGRPGPKTAGTPQAGCRRAGGAGAHPHERVRVEVRLQPFDVHLARAAHELGLDADELFEALARRGLRLVLAGTKVGVVVVLLVLGAFFLGGRGVVRHVRVVEGRTEPHLLLFVGGGAGRRVRLSPPARGGGGGSSDPPWRAVLPAMPFSPT